MGFIDTVYGRRICDLTISALRKFLQKKQQYAIRVGLHDIGEVIQGQLESGARYVDKIYDRSGDVYLIFEIFEK